MQEQGRTLYHDLEPVRIRPLLFLLVERDTCMDNLLETLQSILEAGVLLSSVDQSP